jgi:Fe-S-cluster containining protein
MGAVWQAALNPGDILLKPERRRPNMDDHSAMVCKRCGNCCTTNLVAYIHDEDLQRWKNEGRTDILILLEKEAVVWAGDHLISACNGNYVQGCPFLSWDGKLFSCDIYQTRPMVCRNYQAGSSELCSQFKGR